LLNRKSSFTKYVYTFLVCILVICLVIPATPRIANGGQNPSAEEISLIFDRVAKEKQVPAEILKAIAYTESGWRQWDSSGNVVANYAGKTPYLGIMQVGTYNPADTAFVNRLKNDIAFNIAYGAEVLLSKWNMTPQIGDGDKSKLENWYFAIWAYNTWSSRNNPNDAAQSGRVTYQDKILQLAATEYYKGVVRPVQITPLSRSVIPTGSLPSKNGNWNTPEPVHYAAFSTAVPIVSRSSEEMALLASVPRIAGTDRIDTAIKIADQGFPYGCETVIIARSGDFPDALAGVALAKMNKAPILLTPQDGLDTRVIESLLRLKPLKVIILGGKAAISEQVENELKECLTWTEDIQRIAGQDRFETAAQIARLFSDVQGMAITTGFDFPDALSLASASATRGYPLLLVGKDHLPQATAEILETMAPQFLYIAGGEQVVSSKLLDNMRQISGLAEENIYRFVGENRYETSTLIIKTMYPELDKIFLATGQDFPDALAGAALAANSNTPMLLVPPTGLTKDCSTAQYIDSLSNNLEINVFGGKIAVSDETIIQVKQLLK